MRAGRLRHKVTLQRPTNEEVRRGIPQSYEDVSQAWASIKPILVAEQESNRKLKILGTYEILLWSTDITESWRIKHGSYIYNVTEIHEVGDYGLELRIVAVREKNA